MKQFNEISRIYEASIEGVVLAESVSVADTFRTRTIGLLNRNSLPVQEMLWIRKAPSIHTFGMRFALDIIFLSRTRVIVRVAWDVSPCRFALGGFGADSVLEAQTGWIDHDVIRVGKSVVFSPKKEIRTA